MLLLHHLCVPLFQFISHKMTSAAEVSWGMEIIYCILLCILDSERANQSIQQLSSTLEQLSPDGEEVEEVRGSDGSLFTGMAEEATWSQKTQSEAGDSVISCGMADIIVQHLEIYLLIVLLTDNAQSYNKMLLVCVCLHVCWCYS